MEYEAPKKKQVEIGTYTGICYLVADIGTQKTDYLGEAKELPQIIIGWELPDELDSYGKPIQLIKTYTLSFGDKASLAIDYKKWTGATDAKKINFSSLIGKGCNISTGHTSGGNAKVVSISALKKGELVPTLVSEPVEFYLLKPSDEALHKLPSFISEKIMASPEYQALANGAVDKRILPQDGFADSEIPF